MLNGQCSMVKLARSLAQNTELGKRLSAARGRDPSVRAAQASMFNDQIKAVVFKYSLDFGSS